MDDRQSLRAVLYCRVSKDALRTEKSVTDQETELRAAAEREHWRIVEVIPETGSASRHARRERERWPEVIELIDSARVDVLATWEFSRATREMRFYLALRDACVRAGVRWWYGGQFYDMSTRDGRFRTGLDALLAEDEADRTAERVTRGMRSSAVSGRPGPGHSSYGYRRVYDPATGRLLGQEIDPQTAPIVREIAKRILDGETTRRIMIDLHARGILSPQGRPWTITGVHKMITRPGLAGLRVYRQQVIGKADWEPILDEDIHHQLVAKLSDPSRRTSIDAGVRHLLTGIVRCGVCEAPMRQKMIGKRSQYTCARFHVSRREGFVDDIVTRVLIARLSLPDAAELFAPDTSAETDRARQESAELRRRLAEFEEQATAGNLSAAAFGRIEAKLLPQIEQAERRASLGHLPASVRRLVEGDAASVWDELLIEQRRDVVRTLLDVHIDKAEGRLDPRSVRIEWRR